MSHHCRIVEKIIKLGLSKKVTVNRFDAYPALLLDGKSCPEPESEQKEGLDKEAAVVVAAAAATTAGNARRRKEGEEKDDAAAVVAVEAKRKND